MRIYKPLSQETKAKISASKKGTPAWNKGIKRHWDSPTQFTKGHTPHNKGKPWNIGNKHPNWKGGRQILQNGYAYIWISPRKRQYEHRFVMEKHLNRKLTTKEHIHHINGIKLDNRIENLQLLTTSEHNHLHATRQWQDKGSLRKIYK